MTQKVHSSLSKHLMSDCSGVCTLASSGELFGPPPTPASHPQRVWICCQDHEPQVPLFTAHCLKVYREVGGSDGKESAHSVGDSGSIPGSGRSPEEGNGTPLQYSCLENSMERGAWWAAIKSMGLQGVRHDWEINTHIFLVWFEKTLPLKSKWAILEKKSYFKFKGDLYGKHVYAQICSICIYSDIKMYIYYIYIYMYTYIYIYAHTHIYVYTYKVCISSDMQVILPLWQK